MAVTLFMRVPELEPGRYDRMMRELDLDANPPAGLILHVASEAVGEHQRVRDLADASGGRELRRAQAARGGLRR